MRETDKTIEAMKQALEALQYPWKSQPHTVVNAITALRAAIAEASEQDVQQAFYALENPAEAKPAGIENAVAVLLSAAAEQQDWSETEALRESLREHMAEIHRLKSELAMHRITDVQQEMEFGANSVSITALPTHDYVKEARQILEDAASVGFVSVVVFGFKDRQVHIKHSSMVNELELFGALEAAKMQLWGRGE